MTRRMFTPGQRVTLKQELSEGYVDAAYADGSVVVKFKMDVAPGVVIDLRIYGDAADAVLQ